jgi:hypothetical protein
MVVVCCCDLHVLLIFCCEFPQPSGEMLLCLLKSGEELNDLLKETPERVLLRWMNYHLSNSGSVSQRIAFAELVVGFQRLLVILV